MMRRRRRRPAEGIEKEKRVGKMQRLLHNRVTGTRRRMDKKALRGGQIEREYRREKRVCKHTPQQHNQTKTPGVCGLRTCLMTRGGLRGMMIVVQSSGHGTEQAEPWKEVTAIMVREDEGGRVREGWRCRGGD